MTPSAGRCRCEGRRERAGEGGNRPSWGHQSGQALQGEGLGGLLWQFTCLSLGHTVTISLGDWEMVEAEDFFIDLFIAVLATPDDAQDSLLALGSGVTLGELRGLCGMLGIRSGSAVCKARAPLTVPEFWPQVPLRIFDGCATSGGAQRLLSI